MGKTQAIRHRASKKDEVDSADFWGRFCGNFGRDSAKFVGRFCGNLCDFLKIFSKNAESKI
ncbi:hypothetical protein ACWIUD_03445 [Helicobacter sp. 23-1044]